MARLTVVVVAVMLYAAGVAAQDTWRGLTVADEVSRDGYDRRSYGTGYRSLEDDIIAALPGRTMKQDGQAYTPYTCTPYPVRDDGTAATDIDHIVALAEAHDSGLADDRRREFAADPLNLMIAVPAVNRWQKGARDAGEWGPDFHRAWFALHVIAVKRKYDLAIDARERDGLRSMLRAGAANLNCRRVVPEW